MIEKLITGRAVVDFRILEHGLCSLPLDGGYSLTIETLCRFVGRNGEFISFQDHEQLFGLPAPFDASIEISKAIKGKTIQKVRFAEATGDLTLIFEVGRLEIVCCSAGYECYQINGPKNIIVVRGGSRRPSNQRVNRTVTGSGSREISTGFTGAAQPVTRIVITINT